MRGYLAGLAVVVAISITTILLASIFPEASLLRTRIYAVMFPLAVLFVTMRHGPGPAVGSAVAGVFVFDYAFIPPALEFSLPSLRDGMTLGVMLVVAAIASVLAERLRREVQRVRRQTEVERLRNALLEGLSHDLRAPLTSLVGMGRALDEDRLDPSQRREFSRVVYQEATRLQRLVGSLLELTRLESGRLATKPGPQAIDEVVGAALCRLEKDLAGRSVRTNVPEAVPLTQFDPVLIEQVMVNLVENVLRHTPDSSPVQISAWVEQGHVVVEVADRGPGVPPEEEEKVFEKFYRVAGKRQGDGGMGLGLPLCRAILVAHGGRIFLKNRTGGGAAVRFALPIVDDDGADITPSDSLVPESGSA